MDLHDLLKTLDSQGFSVIPTFDGNIQRFNRDGNLNGWFHGKTLEVNGETLYIARYGDWKTQEEYEWTSKGLESDLDAESRRELGILREKAALERENRYAEAAKMAAELYSKAQPLGTHEYLTKKKLPLLYPARLITGNSGGAYLLVPLGELESRTLTSLQTIASTGQKKFFPGGKIKGSACVIDNPNSDWKSAAKIFISEGYATGASVFLSQEKKYPVVCAMTCSNLEGIGLEVRRLCPDAEIIFAADNDAHTEGNPGLTSAREAASRCGARVVYPVFDSAEGKPTDWNDLHVREGIERVTAQIEGALSTMQDRVLVPVELIRTKTGWKLPDQQIIADQLLKFFGQDIVRHDKDLFLYAGTHWKHVDINGTFRLRNMIQAICSKKAKANEVDQIYKLFLSSVSEPRHGVSMFSPHPFCVNFLNGTLHVERDSSHFYKMRFAPHERTDYLINVLPYEYKEDWSERNPAFDEMMGRIFEGESDAQEKVKALQQMFGACLMPAFPHFFFLWGGAGTGKSTIIKIATNLMHKDNLSSVGPSEFTGFNMAGMAGKLVNYDADVDLTKPLSDAMLKKILDRLPFRIQRKNQTDLMAPLPGLHIFGGNEIPKTLDGLSGAHKRRWTFIGFNQVQTVGQYNKEFAAWVWEQGERGILNFALEGLKALLAARGHYFQPASGVAKMEEWQLSSDPVGLFINDLKQGEVLDESTRRKCLDDGCRLERKQLWRLYGQWHMETFNFAPRTGKIKFYDALRSKKIVESSSEGVRYFGGFDIGAGHGAKF